ncbi:hypothetical protein TNIN_406081 [Trichonephila inaurata madagascariensis]|uniref:Uncharacterized protein n=1 Tax=Trichonephila inaurata madagascariensis TaxID=2747483 RepID=A0A8X6YEU1_9ARAC|nr:hypothetical protein TNIN_406081 [Trichonephila inaurata madagascariensis]
MCKTLDLKTELVPQPGETTLSQTPHKHIDQTTVVPVVGLFSVWTHLLASHARLWIFLPLATQRSSEQLLSADRTNQFQWCTQLPFLKCAHKALNLRALNWFLSKILNNILQYYII